MILLTEALSVFFALKKKTAVPLHSGHVKLKLKKKKQYHLLLPFTSPFHILRYCLLIESSDTELDEYICGTTHATLLRPFGKSWFFTTRTTVFGVRHVTRTFQLTCCKLYLYIWITELYWFYHR